jgi:hypothetical protein
MDVIGKPDFLPKLSREFGSGERRRGFVCKLFFVLEVKNPALPKINMKYLAFRKIRIPL